MAYINGKKIFVPINATIEGGLPNGYTVNFKVNNADYYIASCLQGNDVTAPPDPTAADLFFHSWKDANNNDVAFPYTPNGNTELTANFVNYRVVDYIQSNGTQNQYIDTGYVPNDNSSFECDFEMLSNTAEFRGIFGTYGQNTDKIFVRINNDGRPFIGWGAENSYWGRSGDLSFNTRYKITLNSGQVTITNVATGAIVKQATFTGGSINTAKNIWLFKINDLDTNCHNRIYSFKIFENNQLVKNFVPVETSAGTGAMIETVNGTLFTNDGDGDFSVPTE